MDKLNAKDLYASLKAQLRENESIMVSNLTVMRDSVENLGDVECRGLVLFSCPLNQGFSIPYCSCKRYQECVEKAYSDGKCKGKLTRLDIELMKKAPVLALNSQSNGVKPIGRAIAFMNAGLRLECTIKAWHYMPGTRSSYRTLKVLSSLTPADKELIEEFGNVEHAAYRAIKY